ncbi:MAG: hypothetical protein ATN36_02295 [Epulopiscium sp. Nele67-Bin005]|nr:MAG: hypothetical protein ATN36_02295 [Epulopiscium sp. Nele67-Bin005]
MQYNGNTLQEQWAKQLVNKDSTLEERIQHLRENKFNMHLINELVEQLYLESIRENSARIAYIDDPTEAIQIEAIRLNPHNLGYIKEPTERVKLTAVGIDGGVIQLIKGPTENILTEALHNFKTWLLHYGNNPHSVQIDYAEVIVKSCLFINSSSATKAIKKTASNILKQALDIVDAHQDELE